MINQATLVGRVGKLDIKTTSSGTKIANLSMVTSKKYMKDGVKQEKATWHNVVAFNKVAEIIEKYVHVGDMLYIQGEMDNQKYTTQDGQERYKYFIMVQTIDLLPKSKENQAVQKSEPTNNSFIIDDEVPF